MPIETQSKVSLISNALVLLGEKPLQALNDDRFGATVGANLFELLYENELQSNPWRFTMKKASLGQLNLTPLNQYANVFQIPTDCLLVRNVYPRVDYEIFGDRIYTDNTSVELDYQFKPEISKCPAHFCTLMVYALARDMVSPITEKDAAVAIFQKKYVVQRDRAMYADAQARPPKMVVDSPFTDVRGA